MLHDLKSVDCPRSFVFRGTKEYSHARIQEILGFKSALSDQKSTAVGGNAAFLNPQQQAQFRAIASRFLSIFVAML